MIRGEVSDSIPIDLIIEIISRLPAKSIARLRCVSKLWRSTFLRPYFTELFLTRSSARPPRLLFIVGREDWCFFTSPQPQNPYEKSSSSLLVAAKFHMKFHGGKWPEFCDSVSGLISLTRDTCTMICNPTTGHYASLPLPEGRKYRSLLGFDPIEKQFKVLFHDYKEAPDQILTLGTGNSSWGKIHCPLRHAPYSQCDPICINGVLYYLAHEVNHLPSLIVCFDVRSETFKFIYTDFFGDRHRRKLINYKGKLGVITLERDVSGHLDRPCYLELRMYVIKDVEKSESSEWSEYSSFVDRHDLTIVGATATGEVVLSTMDPSKPFYVFFLNPEMNTRQKVEIEGFRAIGGAVKVFVDHVEDLKFINMKKTYASTSREQKTTPTSSKPHLQQEDRPSKFESINKFDSLLLDDR